MTAYVVLRDYPLSAGRSGPAITMTTADAAAYATDERQRKSVVVAPGEKLTERQALEAMLIPSGNNIASMLASWDAGSEGAFVAKMNARARSLGLRGTRYADASGADPATVSTVSDQFRLTLRALQIPAFRQIVAMLQVTLPVAGVAYNVNSSLGHDGIVGVKTGSSSQAGGCLAFAAIRAVAGGPVTIVGVVLGVRATSGATAHHRPDARFRPICHFPRRVGAGGDDHPATWQARVPWIEGFPSCRTVSVRVSFIYVQGRPRMPAPFTSSADGRPWTRVDGRS